MYVCVPVCLVPSQVTVLLPAQRRGEQCPAAHGSPRIPEGSGSPGVQREERAESIHTSEICLSFVTLVSAIY